MHRLSVVLLMLVTCVLPATLAPGPASAMTRCTITGTAGDDVLVGTTRRDVICGLGGDDVLRGRGGDDSLYGGTGSDRLRGGARFDHLYGGPGEDRLEGGLDPDQLRGGPGDDHLLGGNHSDLLRGGGGDDDLVGGRDEDELDGGRGADTCPYDQRDVARRSCLYDSGPPEIVSIVASPSEVDVTEAGAEVVVRVHLRDDNPLGINTWHPYVQSSVGGTRLRGRPSDDLVHVSGSLSDGVWEWRARIPRGLPPGTLSAMAAVRDEAFTVVTRTERDLMAVHDDAPDLVAPSLELLAPASEATVRLRRGWNELPFRVRAADDDSGVHRIWACLEDADGAILGYCADRPRLVSGTRSDGTWEGTIGVPSRGTPTGAVGLRLWVTDRARPDDADFAYGCENLELPRQPFVGQSGCLTLVGRG